MNYPGTGLVHSPLSTTDYRYEHLALAGSPFDWRVGYDVEHELGFHLKPNNQYQRLSCVGESASKLAYVLNAFELQPIYYSSLESVLEEISPRSIYSQIALPYGGAFTRDALALLCRYGANLEKEVSSFTVDGKPMTEAEFKTLTWKDYYTDHMAQIHKGKEYRFVYPYGAIDLVAQTIRDNKAVLLGFNLDYTFNDNSWLQTFVKAPTRVNNNGIAMFGHLVLGARARLINGKKYIGILNSWGNIGERGWQWIGEDYFNSGSAHSVGILIDKPNSLWMTMIDRNGRARRFPTYFLKTIRYMIDRGYATTKPKYYGVRRS